MTTATHRRAALNRSAARRRWLPLQPLEQRVLLTGSIPTVLGPGSPATPGPILTTLTPTFTWTPVTGVAGLSHYQLNLFDLTRSQFNSFYTDPAATSLTLPETIMHSSDAYVFNLRIDVGSTPGAPSTYFYFRAPPAPALPRPVITSGGSTITPGPTLTTLTPTFTWNAVPATPGMTHYQINLFDLTKSVFHSFYTSPTATSFTVPETILTAGDAYVWNLRIDVGSVTGPESAYFYFKAPPAPTLPKPVITGPGNTITPGTTVTTLTPNFTWNAVPATAGMTHYQINLFDLTKSVFHSFYTDPTATSFALPSGILVSGDAYVWNLRVDVGSTTGPESAYYYFKAPPAPALPTPVITGPGDTTASGPVITTTTPTFTWTAVPTTAGMTAYQINLYDKTTAVFTTYRTSSPTATSYTLAPGILISGDSYVWNLRIVVGSITGPESAYFNFQVQ